MVKSYLGDNVGKKESAIGFLFIFGQVDLLVFKISG